MPSIKTELWKVDNRQRNFVNYLRAIILFLLNVLLFASCLFVLGVMGLNLLGERNNSLINVK